MTPGDAHLTSQSGGPVLNNPLTPFQYGYLAGPPVPPPYGGGGGPPPYGTYPPYGGTTTPQSFIGEDQSVGKSNELFGISADEDYSILAAMCPPGLTPEQQARLSSQTLDAAGLPGTHGKSTEDAQMNRLAEGIAMMATGRINSAYSHLGGMSDTGWKSTSRVALGSIKTMEELRARGSSIESNRDKILGQVVAGLKSVLISANYHPDHAQQYAHQSGFLRISAGALSAYQGLHVHLICTAAKYGFDYAKTELEYHARKLLEIRSLGITRLQVVVQSYIYLRNIQRSGWQTTGLQVRRINLLQRATLTTAGNNAEAPTPSPTPTNAQSFCNHCRTSLHAGNRSQCPFKEDSKSVAQEKGRATLRRLADGG